MTSDSTHMAVCALRGVGPISGPPTVGFSGRVLAEPVGKPDGSALVGPPELNRRQHFRFREMDA